VFVMLNPNKHEL